MKKIITAALIIALGINSNAQGNEKDFRFGLKIEPSFNWLSPDKADKFEKIKKLVKKMIGKKMKNNMNALCQL